MLLREKPLSPDEQGEVQTPQGILGLFARCAVAAQVENRCALLLEFRLYLGDSARYRVQFALAVVKRRWDDSFAPRSALFRTPFPFRPALPAPKRTTARPSTPSGPTHRRTLNPRAGEQDGQTTIGRQLRQFEAQIITHCRDLGRQHRQQSINLSVNIDDRPRLLLQQLNALREQGVNRLRLDEHVALLRQRPRCKRRRA